jgi:hypothetical protein
MNTVQKTVGMVTETTGNVVGDVLMTVLKVITGLTSGSEHVISTLGSTIQGLGDDVKVVAHHVASGVGNLAVTISNKLGDVVERVPLAGKPTAFVVRKAGTGIYYLVLTVSDLVGTVSKTAGKGVKAGTKVIVFTLGKGSELSETVLNESNRMVQVALGKVNKLTGAKTVKRNSLSSRRRSQKH